MRVHIKFYPIRKSGRGLGNTINIDIPVGRTADDEFIARHIAEFRGVDAQVTCPGTRGATKSYFSTVSMSDTDITRPTAQSSG
jgi:hypothetical protein